MNIKRFVFAVACVVLLGGIAAGVRAYFRPEEVFDFAAGAKVTAWDRLIHQQDEGGEADARIAAYAALPQPATPLDVAQIWALAVQQRDGCAQFALLSSEQQQKQRIRYEAAGWVSGVSSPWVESFDIAGKKDDYKVAFALNTSTGIFGSFTVLLRTETVGGVCRISKIELVEGDAQPYILSALD